MSASFTLHFDHADFLVIEKAAGVNFHDEEDIGSGLFSQVKARFSDESLFPVHRLDKMTSGLLIIAKSLECAQYFQQLFETRRIDKYYLALSDLKPKKKQGLIVGDMAKSRRGSWKLLRTKENPAITQFFSYSIASKLRLFCLKPHTGKTHQIRVALASIASPIIGDDYYHAKQPSNNESTSPDRGYLHAFCVKFTYKQQDFSFLAPPTTGHLFLTDGCQQQLQHIGDPSSLPWPTV